MGSSIKTTLLTLSLSTLVLASQGCDIIGTTSCDFREGSVNGPEPRCQERSGVQGGGETFKTACEALQGEAIEGECPQEGIVLGCDLGGDVIDWYYSPKTEEEVKADCENEGTIVQP